MTVNFEKNGTTLTVKPEGRLDSRTAPDLGTRLFEVLGDTSELVFDLADLEYTSSAGLRVLLSAQQEMERRDASMKVIHVNKSVMEVFDMAGFLAFIDVE